MPNTSFDPLACGPCEPPRIFHLWIWASVQSGCRTGGRWECKFCDAISSACRYSDLPCVHCGRHIESPFCTTTCGPCLDAMLGLDVDDNYVPFEEEVTE